MAACVIMGWSLIYTATTYRSPQDKRVDVYILSNTASDEMVQAFLEPVWKETVPEMEVVNGTINVSDIDLTKGYVTSVDEYDDQDRPVKTSSHLYGIPMDSFYGFMGGMQLDNRGMYAVITVNNQNDENVIPFFSALLKAGQGEKEAWITE